LRRRTDSDKKITTFAREAPHALALGAEHPGNCFRQISLIERFIRAFIGTNHPDVALLDSGQTAGVIPVRS
jgi:hypothetical protein